MSQPVYFLTIGMVLATILAIFGMRYRSTGQQAKARLAEEQAYREIATRAVADQAGTAATLASIQSELTGIGTRLAAIERVLKEVE